MAAPGLTIDIGASTKQYDRAMKDIGDKADDVVGSIEKKFESFDPKINSQNYISSLQSMIGLAGQLATRLGVVGAAGVAIGTAAAAFGAITALTVKLNQSLEDTANTAERVGVSLKDYQSIRFGGNSVGLGDDQINASLDNFATNLQNAKFTANDLTRAFQANGIAIKDASGAQKDTNVLLQQAFDIVQRQKSVQDAIQVGSFFGFSKEFSQSIKDAGTSFQDLTAKAKAAGAVIDDATFEKAKEFTKAWNEATTKWSEGVKSALDDILPLLDSAVTGAIKLLGTLTAAAKSYPTSLSGAVSVLGGISADGSSTVDVPAAPKDMTGTNQAGLQIAASWEGVRDKINEANSAMKDFNANSAKNPGPNISAQGDAVDRAINSINKHILATQADATAVGDSAAALARLRVEAAETAAVQANGGKETQAQIDHFNQLKVAAAGAADALARAQINNLISRGQQTSLLSPEDVQIANQLKDIYPNVAEALGSTEAAALRANQALSGLSSQISSDLTNGLTDIVSGTKSVKDGFSDLAQSVLKDIQQMIIKIAIVGPLMRSLQSTFGLGSLLGVSTGGSVNVVGGAGSLAVPTFATGGGVLSGPGTGTSDSILARVSNGEYIVNAKSASRFRSLLDTINYAPGFAAGGAVSRSSSGAPGGSSGGIAVTIIQNNDFSSGITGNDQAFIESRLQQNKQETVAATIGAIRSGNSRDSRFLG